MKVKVISIQHIFQVLYVLCFTRPRYQVSVYRTIGPLVIYLNGVRMAKNGLDFMSNILYESKPIYLLIAQNISDNLKGPKVKYDSVNIK